MNSLNSLKLAELRQRELRLDAARARLAADARRGRRRRARPDWLRRVAGRWRGHQAGTAPATLTPVARPVPFDGLAARFAAEGPAAVRDELSGFVALATARGATPTLLSVLVDDDQPDVARQRALQRVVAELTSPARGSVRERSDKPDAA
jgi:hypothetical protein